MNEPTPSVLIVEDEVDLLRTLEYNFKNAGFAVSTTTRGRAAMQLAAAAILACVPLFNLLAYEFCLAMGLLTACTAPWIAGATARKSASSMPRGLLWL